MMHEWFYVVEDGQRGPVDEAQLRSLLKRNVLSGDTLVWRDGMRDWVAASSLPELRSSGTEAASGAEGEAISPWAEGTQIRPWVRMWARCIDVMCFSAVVGVVLGYLQPDLKVEGNLALPILVLLGLCFVEPLFLSFWGTTPGKGLLKIRVRRADGGFLSYRQAFERSIYVWIRGLGMGLPFVGMITQFLAYRDLMTTGSTAWDRMGAFRVEHAVIGRQRAGLIIAIMLGWLVMGLSGGGGLA
jgi:uncharacterized RDD family membrane protein YckC